MIGVQIGQSQGEGAAAAAAGGLGVQPQQQRRCHSQRPPQSSSGTWRPKWALSKPAKWTLTIRWGTVTVGTFTNDSYGTAVMPDWAPGAPTAGNGAAPTRRTGAVFTWTLTLVPADGVGNSLTLKGLITSRQVAPRRLMEL